MAFDAETAERVRCVLRRRRGFEEKKMFGGVGFPRDGHMCVGVWKEFLILRVGPENYAAALTDEHAREFDVTGRSMTGWVMLEPAGFADDAALRSWVELAVSFVRTLPPKSRGG